MQILGDALVQNRVEARKESLREIEVRQHQPIVQLERGPLIARGFEQNLHVLFDARVGLGLQGLLELRSDRIEICLLPLDDVRFQVEHVSVVPLDADLRGALGRILHQHVQKPPGQLIAAGNPILAGLGTGFCGSPRYHERAGHRERKGCGTKLHGLSFYVKMLT